MKHTLWYKAILLGAVVLAVLLVGLVPRATPAAAAGSISLRNATVPQGATVSVSGSSFTSNDTVALYVDTTVNGRGQRIQTAVTADGNGSFSTRLALPRNVDPRSYTVNARDTHGVSASAHLAVLPLIVLRVNSGAPTISVTDRQGFF